MSAETELDAARTAYGRELRGVYVHPTHEWAPRMAEIRDRYVATRKRILKGKEDR